MQALTRYARQWPPGTFSAVGAASTMFRIDSARRGIVVFGVRSLWGGPAKVPYVAPLIAAIEKDLTFVR